MTVPLPPPPPRRSLRPMLILGAAFITFTCVLAAVFAIVRHFEGNPGDGLRPIDQRKPAQLSMPTLEGKNWSSADQTGKVLIINYFATWCPPCRAEMPDLVDIANSQAAKGVIVAAVALDADLDGSPRKAALTAFQQKEHLPFPILLPSLDSPLFATTFPIPQTILIDRHGRSARLILGQFDPADLRTSIDRLLMEP